MAQSPQVVPPIIEQDRYKFGVELIGVKNEVNTDFDTPVPFSVNLYGGGRFFELFRNGQRLILDKQYSVRYFGDVGIGVRIFRPPKPHESLIMNYVKSL